MSTLSQYAHPAHQAHQARTARAAPLLAPLMLAFALAGLATAAQAQSTQSMEERLRAQLRVTTTQLQQAQNELAALKAGVPAAGASTGASTGASAAPGELDALKKELAQSRSQLAAERQAREQQGQSVQQVQQQAQAAIEKSGAQVGQFRTAYDELLKLARASEAERQRLATDSTRQTAAIGQCEAKNQQLYAVGLDLLRAYETVDLGQVMAARQPFAAQSRVRFEEIAQRYGDQLYASRFDPRAAAIPAPPAAPAQP